MRPRKCKYIKYMQLNASFGYQLIIGVTDMANRQVNGVIICATRNYTAGEKFDNWGVSSFLDITKEELKKKGIIV